MINRLQPDSSVVKVEIGYDYFTLFVQHESGPVETVQCIGHIGRQMIGKWDEIIIASSSIYTDHDFIDQCERAVSKWPASGDPSRTKAANKLLEIVFIDGSLFWVCASDFI